MTVDTTVVRRLAQRIDDHALLLQLERANEALEDRVAELEDLTNDPIPSISPHDCDCSCYDSEIGHHEDSLEELRSRLVEAADLIETLVGRVVELERNQSELVGALERALLA